MKTALVALVAALTLGSAATAHAQQVQAPTRHLNGYDWRVVKVKDLAGDRVLVTLNNGAVHRLRPCVFGGPRDCYFDARTMMETGEGASFVTIRSWGIYTNKVDCMAVTKQRSRPRTNAGPC